MDGCTACRRSAGSVLCAILLAAGLPAPAANAGDASAANGVYCLTLEGAAEGGHAVQLRLVAVEGYFRSGYATIPQRNNWSYRADPAGLNIAAPRLQGKLDLWLQRSAAGVVQYTVQASIQGRKISGTFSGGPVRSGGKLSGRIAAWSELPGPEDSIAAGKAWPTWLGPGSTCAAPDSGRQLVESLERARFVWRSEEILPDGRADDARKSAPRKWATTSGGFASPVVAEGRLYFFYYVPSGTIHHEGITAQQRQIGGPGKEKWMVNADDIILCIDARTGQTLWKRVFREKGLNLGNTFNKSGPHLGTCYYRGRIYSLGTAGRVYCIDAKTGRPIWESSMGPRAELQEYARKFGLANRVTIGTRSNMCIMLAVADGAVVCNTQILYKGGQRAEDNGLIGLDAGTGKRLWLRRKCAGGSSSPVIWIHGQKEYVVCSGAGKAVALEPRTGRLLWEVPCASGQPIVSTSHLVGAGTGKNSGQLVCWRIDPAKAERIWALPAGHGTPQFAAMYKGHMYVRGNKGLICVELETGKIEGSCNVPSAGYYVVAHEGRLVVGPDLGHCVKDLRMVRADPDKLENLGPVWQGPWIAGSYTVPTIPAVADGRVFFRGVDGIVCYDLRQRTAK